MLHSFDASLHRVKTPLSPLLCPLIAKGDILVYYLSAAVMVWLNYRNAYEYWHEQRMALTTEIKEATQNVLEQTHLAQALGIPLSASQGQNTGGTLFLQLTVNDIG